MAEKVKTLNLERDYKKFLYYIDGDGRVCRKLRGSSQEAEVIDPGVQRDFGYLYFIDTDGDIARTPRK